MDPNETGRPVDNPTFRYFMEEAALWRRARIAASDVADAAVQALLDGVESPTFILIAGLSKAEAEGELGELLESRRLLRHPRLRAESEPRTTRA